MPASTYKAISTFTLSSNTQFVTISNIPQNYTDLVVVIDGVSTAGTYIRASFNNAADVSYTAAINNPSSPYTPGAFKGTGGFTGLAGGSNRNQIFFYFQNYSSNIQNKAYLGQTRQGVGGSYWSNTSGTIVTTAPITSITYWGDSGNVMAGSTISVYGLSGNSLKATGGDIIATDGTYWYHAFTKSGTFTPNSTLSCDVLIVAGGGGAGRSQSGGGGAGGLVYSTSNSFSTAQAVTVGAGGAAGTGNGRGTNGSNSIVGSLTAAVGGGGGGGYDNPTGANGGSGGGGASSNISGTSQSGGTGTAGQGNAGGSTSGYASPYRGAGGGGAGAVGANGYTSTGNGGIGVNTYATMLNTTGTGVSGYIAGGGGGGQFAGTPGGEGGLGGGGAGGDSIKLYGASGLRNTGGGGGGSEYGYAAGSGGSGLVIVRYLV